MSDTMEMPISDVNDLDDVVRELGLEASEVTPAEAVRKLKGEIAALTARAEQAERRALSAEDIGTLQAAVENMRSADRTDAIIEARWRIASKLEAISRRYHEQGLAKESGQ